MLRSHYAPRAVVELIDAAELADRLDDQLADERSSSIGVLAPFSVDHTPSWPVPADPAGYASRLYAVLREADELGVARLLVVPPRPGPLFDAVLDRLTKASAPRPVDQPRP